MAASSPYGKSINLGSDQIPESYCEPCHDISGDIKPVAGYCLNCDEGLCKECYDSHLRRKQFRNHQLQVDKSTRPRSKTPSKHKHQDSAHKCSRHQGETVSISQQMVKQPTHVKDIEVSDISLCWHGSVVLPNQKLLITDNQYQKVKLIDTNKRTYLSQIQLSGTPKNITKVKTNEFAVLLNNPNKIQILNLSQNLLSCGRGLSVSSGACYGLAYNDKDQIFVVAFYIEGKVELINSIGTVIRTIQTDSKGSAMFGALFGVAFKPDRSGMYVTDAKNHTVTLLSLNGDVKAVYKDKGLNYPHGICVHRSGVVYVAGYLSNTTHQLDPDSGEFKLLLGQKDGLYEPYSISYCDVENKMYVGLFNSLTLKVFEMK